MLQIGPSKPCWFVATASLVPTRNFCCGVRWMTASLVGNGAAGSVRAWVWMYHQNINHQLVIAHIFPIISSVGFIVFDISGTFISLCQWTNDTPVLNDPQWSTTPYRRKRQNTMDLSVAKKYFNENFITICFSFLSWYLYVFDFLYVR